MANAVACCFSRTNYETSDLERVCVLFYASKARVGHMAATWRPPLSAIGMSLPCLKCRLVSDAPVDGTAYIPYVTRLPYTQSLSYSIPPAFEFKNAVRLEEKTDKKTKQKQQELIIHVYENNRPTYLATSFGLKL